MNNGGTEMKKILVLLIVLFLFLYSASAKAQCKIFPEGVNIFPDNLSSDSIQIEGTWMSVEKPYDPRNPNTSVVRCERQNKECRVTTAYIAYLADSNLLRLGLWEGHYKVEAWNREIIVAMAVSWEDEQSGRPILTIRRSDKSVVEDNSTLAKVLFYPIVPVNRQMVLKEGNPLFNKSLKEFYGM